MIGDELAQHRHEDVDRVRGLSFLIRETAAAERVIRAVHLRAAVDQEQRRAGHLLTISLPLMPVRMCQLALVAGRRDVRR